MPPTTLLPTSNTSTTAASSSSSRPAYGRRLSAALSEPARRRRSAAAAATNTTSSSARPHQQGGEETKEQSSHTQTAAAAAAAAAAHPPYQQGRRQQRRQRSNKSRSKDERIDPQTFTWRNHLHKALRGKLMMIANIWTVTLIVIILLAVIFRAMQPTEAPAIHIVRYAWSIDPNNVSRISLAEVDLDAHGVGRFFMEYSASSLNIIPLEAEEDLGSIEDSDDPDWASQVLAKVPLPAWTVELGHDGSTVTAIGASEYFAPPPPTSPSPLMSPDEGGGEEVSKGEVIVVGNFVGNVTVFASLPARLFLKCRLKLPSAASILGPNHDNVLVHLEEPVCMSEYLPHIREGRL